VECVGLLEVVHCAAQASSMVFLAIFPPGRMQYSVAWLVHLQLEQIGLFAQSQDEVDARKAAGMDEGALGNPWSMQLLMSSSSFLIW
jgi:hypothetical protein